MRLTGSPAQEAKVEENKRQGTVCGGRPLLNHQFIFLPLLWAAQNPTVGCQLDIRYHVSKNQFLSPSIYYHFCSLKKKQIWKFLPWHWVAALETAFARNHPPPISWAVLRDVGQADSNLATSRFLGETVPFPSVQWSLDPCQERKAEKGFLSIQPHWGTPSQPTLSLSYAFLSLLSTSFCHKCKVWIGVTKSSWEQRILFNSLRIIPCNKNKNEMSHFLKAGAGA